MIRIQEDDFSIEDVTRELRGEGIGAIVTFTGMVRGASKNGTPVVCVEWETYESMARAEFGAIRQEAIAQFGLQNAAIVHRCGRQKPGENLVLIAAAAAHRNEAFRACEFIMDEIKKRAPLWKKEIYPDGCGEWIQG